MQFPNIRAEMARAGMTRLDLAKYLGKTEKTVFNWLHGKSQIPASALVEMAKRFNCSTDYLLGRTDRPS